MFRVQSAQEGTEEEARAPEPLGGVVHQLPIMPGSTGAAPRGLGAGLAQGAAAALAHASAQWAQSFPPHSQDCPLGT